MTKLTDAGFTALWAGGCVRDYILGKTPKDYDVATDAIPDQVREVFGRRRTLSVGESFGVIIVRGPREAGQVEVATFRNDGTYLDGRRPESVEFTSPEEDARRRDFTINGMFYDPLHDKVLDFVGGRADLEAGIVRAIGDPIQRMTEDKLRMLRAVRFAATFEFTLDPSTADSIRSMADQLSVVSAERISQELKRMLVDPHRSRAIELCRETDMLLQVVPALSPVLDTESERLLSLLNALDEPSFPLAFATLLLPVAESSQLPLHETCELAQNASHRLKLSNRETHDAGWLLSSRDSLNNASTLSLASLKRVLANPLARDLLHLMTARSRASNEPADDADFCSDFLTCTPAEELSPAPLLTGDDLIRSGLTPGPKFKELLTQVRDAQLNLDISSPEEALDLARQLIEP